MNDPDVRKRSWEMKLEHTASERLPNSGHAALVTLEGRGKLHTLITQNVDGLHHGNEVALFVELHPLGVHFSIQVDGEVGHARNGLIDTHKLYLNPFFPSGNFFNNWYMFMGIFGLPFYLYLTKINKSV